MLEHHRIGVWVNLDNAYLGFILIEVEVKGEDSGFILLNQVRQRPTVPLESSSLPSLNVWVPMKMNGPATASSPLPRADLLPNQA
jgi:hypothetical protein